MKRFAASLLLTLAALMYLPCCVSCTDPDNPGTDIPSPPDPDDPVKGKLEPGPYTFTVSPFKGKWEAGDKIHVHGSYGPAAKNFTLTAADISADGKTATLQLDAELLKYLSAPDQLYASWPAEAVQEEDGLTDATTTFTIPNILLAQAYLEGTNFTFDDASAAITFTVSGGFDHVMIAGTERPGLRLLNYENMHSSAQTSFNKFSSDGYPFREESLEADGSLNTLWFPGRITLKKGFSLYFGKDGSWTRMYTYKDDTDLKAGKKLDLGDITSKLEAYEGDKPSMPEVSKYTRYDVKFNELSGLCVDASGETLWCLGDGSEIAQLSLTGSVLHQAGLKTTSNSSIDSEGLSLNYDTGDFIISGEANVVCRIPATEIGNIFQSSTFKGVESLFKIDDAKSFGNAGAEGCTYYKDGLVYIGTQTGSYLYLCNLATGEVLWRKGLREMHNIITEIAGLCYDPLTDWLWVIDSESHRFFALTGDGEHLLGTYLLKTKSNEESICVDHKNGCIWVGDDYGSTSHLFRYDFTGLDDAIIH